MQVMMKRISQILVLGLTTAFLSNVLSASAQSGFTVNGRRVSGSTYQAYKLINQSLRLMRENRTVEACQQLKRAILLDPMVPEARSMYGMALARLGKSDAAAEQLRMVIAGDAPAVNARIAALLNLAALCQGSGKTQEALSMYKEVLKQFPHHKIIPAIKERVTLFEKEMARQRKTNHNQKQELMDDTSYYGNVIGQGRKRWPASSMPIRVYVYPATGIPDYKDDYNTILHSSFEEWEKASAGKVRFAFVPTSRDADITCTWVVDGTLLESSAEGGEADVRSLQESVVKSVIMLSLNNNDSPFPFTDNLVRTLCLHEIGHSLGLLGHSMRTTDVLYCSTPLVDAEMHLSKRDIATVRQVYNSDVNPLSQALATLERDSHGNAENILRFSTVALIAVASSVAIFLAVLKRVSKKKPKRKLPLH